MICAVGQERRDYPTLVEAVRGLDLDVAIAAVEPVVEVPRQRRRPGRHRPTSPPAATTCSTLRQLYADAAFVVVPLEETDFQAGITTILEAMSMGKAVVCTRTPGQTDTIVDGVTGLYVPPGDAATLRAAIERLVADPAEADRLGVNGRAWVLEHATLDAYVARLAALLG